MKFGDRRSRAIIVDKIFEIGSMDWLELRDKSQIFQSMALFDRYVENEAWTYINYKSTKTLRTEKLKQFDSIKNKQEQNYQKQKLINHLN